MKFFQNRKNIVMLVTVLTLIAASYASISYIPKTALWLSLPSLGFILGFCALALLSTYSWPQLAKTASLTRQVFSKVDNKHQEEVFELVAYSKLWFRKQFALIDREIVTVHNLLIKNGLQGVRDGQPLQDLITVLTWQSKQQLQSSVDAIKVYSSLSVYASGMGALVALAYVATALSNGAQPNELYQTLAAGLVCMIYGLALANFVFKPLASKLENAYYAQEQKQNLIIEGITLIHHQRTPALVRSNLEAMMEADSARAATLKIQRLLSSHA